MKIPNEGLRIILDKMECGNRKLLYAVISGSHAWGLGRPDSDIDIRGVYLDATTKVLGLNKGTDNIEFNDGIYDIQLYELEKFLRMLCNHNGNMVNLLWLSDASVFDITIPWAYLAKKFLTRKLQFYYRGYADSQRKRAMSQRGGKALIYTYREMFSGLYTMRYGCLEHNFKKLWGEAVKQGWYQGDLLDKYFPNPTQTVTDEGWHRFYSEWDNLCAALNREAEVSPLPLNYDGIEDCTEILLAARVTNLCNKAELDGQS